MKRTISGYLENPLLIKNTNLFQNKSSKRKKLFQSTSEKCVCTNNINTKESQIQSTHKPKFNEKYKVNSINIKFNILQNLRKYNTIFNNKSNKNLEKINQGIKLKNKNSIFHLKSLNNIPNIPRLIINKEKIKSIQNNFDENYTMQDNEKNGLNQLDPHGYFPEDYSLNVFKSTDLYQKRYKIETCRLKKVLKNINTKENTKKNKNIIRLIKKNALNNNISTKMFKLLKSNKIDRFVDRYLNIKNPISHLKSENENIKENQKNNNNNLKKKPRKIFLTNKNNDIIQLNFLDLEELRKKTKIHMHPYTIVNNNEINSNNHYIQYYYRNFSNDNNKTNTANSGTQTININDSNNKNSIINSKEFESDSLNEIKKHIVNRKNVNNLPSHRDNIYSFKEIKFKIIKSPKESYFLKKYKNMMKSFSKVKTNFSYSENRKKIKNNNKNDNKNDNKINNLKKSKKLIFSFYDPKDRFIQLFKKLEKKALTKENSL